MHPAPAPTKYRFLQDYLTPRPANPVATPNAPHEATSDPLLNGTVTLKDLNKVMANAFAAVYWYGASLEIPKSDAVSERPSAGKVNITRLPGESGSQIVQRFTGEATIQTQSIRSQLNVSLPPFT